MEHRNLGAKMETQKPVGQEGDKAEEGVSDCMKGSGTEGAEINIGKGDRTSVPSETELNA